MMISGFKTLAAAFVCVLALAGGQTVAQEAAETPEQAQTGGNEPFVRETIGDWDIRCVRAPEAERELCQMYQLLQDDTGNPVAEFTLVPLEPGGDVDAGATIITPLETLLGEQLRLSVDGGEARAYPYLWCSRIGCFSRIGLRTEEVDQLKRGNAAEVTIVAVANPQEPVELGVSLSGFTAAFDKLQAEQFPDAVQN